MSIKYTTAIAEAKVKRQSRRTIARDIKECATANRIVLHYLGGRATNTPFENLFKGRRDKTTFVRYELHRAETPNMYERTTPATINFEQRDNRNYGFFINGDFFKNYLYIKNKIRDIQYYWLDFCGLPTGPVVNQLYHQVLSHIERDEDSVCYVTFFLNPRNLPKREIESIFGGYGLSRKQRAENIKNYFNNRNQNIQCEVLEIYQNGVSPMGVFKFTNKNMKRKPKTVNDYAKLHNDGFTNKQIAIYWRMSLMQVAGYAAQARKKRLLKA